MVALRPHSIRNQRMKIKEKLYEWETNDENPLLNVLPCIINLIILIIYKSYSPMFSSSFFFMN